MRFGVPQGRVLPPNIFSYYIAKLSNSPCNSNLQMIIYADGISIYGQNPDYKKTVRQTNDFVQEVISFLEDRQLQVLSDKSTVTLIAPFMKYVNDHPQVRIKRSVVPREKKT